MGAGLKEFGVSEKRGGGEEMGGLLIGAREFGVSVTGSMARGRGILGIGAKVGNK